jgi:hypothetical protein
MINRRSMLKLLTLAPIAAPAVAAMPAAASTRYAIVAGDYFPISNSESPIIVMGRAHGVPVYDPRIALTGEVGPEMTFKRRGLRAETAQSVPAHAPYHPELTVHA